MCGRYALSLRPSQVRQRLADQNMPADEAPSDDDSQLRQSYNFAPGYHGLIYRAATNDRGTDATPYDNNHANNGGREDGSDEPSPKKAKLSHPPSSSSEEHQVDGLATKETKYKLQSAKWGLIPFWTKRSPDYGSMLRTINCRDDSLIENRGMWNTMKQRKRCIVLAEGFYEWLKKNAGKEKVPHFVKRKDGGLMCFAGLWDCVQYEDAQEGEKLYTYTVITTDSNKALKFLHDRMPVVLEPGSEEMKRWLDPANVGWNKELQSMLKPFEGELECYPVDKGVGKVGNNSPSFVVPVDSKENKKNIANFFGTQRERAGEVKAKAEEKVEGEDRETTKEVEDPESNAPLPKPQQTSEDELSQAIKQDTNNLDDSAMLQAEDESVEKSIKRETDELDDKAMLQAEDEATERGIKREADSLKDEDLLEAEKSPPQKVWNSPSKSTPGKTRSATSNSNVHKTPTKAGEGNKKITAFFGGK
ncbi:hypothetical protein LTR37_011111 [Vermiconidia calcicola]|uniref:Uncharacterized protein n=1 Tax=Vermiconidia calcicola TaxID=1690605 RepID=A0ACC3N4W5_9PEZI|nr:hypothetical protein LTR37_011111 [Vermiconidia calcicola]